MSTGQSVVMRCGWGVGLKVGWLIPFVDKRVEWQVTLCDPSLIRAILSALVIRGAFSRKGATQMACTQLLPLLYRLFALHWL